MTASPDRPKCGLCPLAAESGPCVGQHGGGSAFCRAIEAGRPGFAAAVLAASRAVEAGEPQPQPVAVVVPPRPTIGHRYQYAPGVVVSAAWRLVCACPSRGGVVPGRCECIRDCALDGRPRAEGTCLDCKLDEAAASLAASG